MKFGMVAIQEGRGCDYSIECGTRFRTFEAKDMADAIRIVTEYDPNEYPSGLTSEQEEACIKYFCSGEHELKKCIVFPIDNATDVTEAYFDFQIKLQDKEEVARKKQKEDAEKAEFERLQKKFGNK